MLSDPAKEFERLEQHYRAGKYKDVKQIQLDINEDILHEHAVTTWSNTCVLESGLEITPPWAALREMSGVPYTHSYVMVVHERCAEIASTVLRKSQNDIHVRSQRTLWKVLRTRYDARDNEYMGTIDGTGPQYIMMDNGYYMPLGFADDYSVWDGDDAHWVRDIP